MIWSILYGVTVIALGLVAWLSRDRTVRIMSAILGLEWLVYNSAVAPDRWRAANPASIGTVAFAVVAMTRLLPPTRLTRALLAIYAAAMLLDVVVALSGATTGRWYFGAVNGTFALRLLVVGGAGVWCALRNWRSMGAGRPLPLYSRGATLVRRRSF